MVKSGSKYSRRNVDEFTDYVKKYKSKGLAWMKMESKKLTGGISKFFSSELQSKIINQLLTTKSFEKTNSLKIKNFLEDQYLLIKI